MPYKSKKQAAYMHIHHPDVAAKWHEEGHGYVEGGPHDPNRKKRRRKVSKLSKPEAGWLKPLAIGAGGGALANQLPSFEQQQKMRENRRRRKAAASQIKKIDYADYVHSDDPEFNHAAAKKTFDLVMKMDDASAEVFTMIAMGQIFETTVEKNLRTLQRHLDDVVSKRIEMLKTAVMRSVSKGNDEGAVEFAKALAALEEISKDEDDIPNWAFERKIRRDKGGRFSVKVSHTQKTPIRTKTARGVGLVPTDADHMKRYAKLTNEQKAQYQDEYRQLGNFLNVATQSGGAGDEGVYLHFRDKWGNEFREKHVGAAADANARLLNPNVSLIGIESNPETLTVGGQAFGLAHALGAEPGPGAGERMAMLNTGLGNLGTFRESWQGQPTDLKGTNERLYNRTAATGAYVGAIAPPNTKVGQAARLAQVVGEHGPEAEAVIGPTARKTAYRYRGVERAPEKHLVEQYNRAVTAAKLANEGAPGGLVDEEELKYRTGGRPGVETATRRPTTIRGVGTAAAAGLAPSQMGAARQKATSRPPTWEERANGRRVIAEQLKLSNVPSGELYNLQAKSGNLPPSEGVMLNKDGQIVSQAVGYGDDHYLPFNLKHLQKLKGGEYIRTRSVGGLTSEDIYTGLMAGARRVTVVSRSGTFSVEFEPDFRGGRRYNDKALRMTRRYESLLDAVQSNQVSRGPVPPQVQQAIAGEVARDYPGQPRATLKKETERRLTEYRQDPDFSPEDQKIVNLVYEQGLKDAPNRDANEWARTARDLVMQGKRFNYQLDASGYEAAQNALAEQFPYYIKSMPVIEKEGERVSREKDKGYVEPGRNRPTAVRAGLYGTEENAAAGEKVGQRKFSASQADYQRGRIGPGANDLHPRRMGTAPPVGERPEPPAATPAGAQAAAGAPGTPAVSQAAQERAQRRAEIGAQDAATELYGVMRNMRLDPSLQTTYSDVFGQSEGDFATWVQDPNNRDRFDSMLDAMHGALSGSQNAELQRTLGNYRRARGDARAVNYEPGNELRWTNQPMNFPGERGYGPEASDEERLDEMRRLDARNRDVITGLPLSQLDDQQSQAYLRALRGVRQELRMDPTLQDDDAPDIINRRREAARAAFGDSYNAQAMNLITGGNDDALRERMVDVHRMRNLRAHFHGQWPGTAQTGPGAPGSPGGPAAQTVNPGNPNSPVPPGQVAAEHNVVGEVINHLGLAAQVKNRRDALAKYREGKDWTEETPGDDALQAADKLNREIENGYQPTEADVKNMLDETQEAFRNVPHKFEDLEPAEQRLYPGHERWFAQDQAGRLHLLPPDQRT